MNTIFFGTSAFAIPALEKLAASHMRPLLVVSTPDRPHGRKLVLSPTPVKEWAEKNAIPVITPEHLNDKHTVRTLQQKNPELFVVASYGKIIPEEILAIPRKGTLNIHPSLLPKLRGPSPIQSTILENEIPGATIMLADKEIDHGPILKSEKLKTKNKKYTYKELEKELAALGAEMLVEIISKWMNEEIEPKEQNHAEATLTKKNEKEYLHINWNKPAEIIERKIRALNPWPGTYAFWLQPRTSKKIRLLILEAKCGNPISEDSLPGTALRTENGALEVNASDKSLIILKIKPAGKKEMSGKEFLRGYGDISHNRLM
ncbi:MAG: methionyl-tRNA formyltransferase [Candidatus Niyogibacteria bacterium]|nr:methionyl-tRNA formyltransferase [Candidatus Niyogibacteria bacterium]